MTGEFADDALAEAADDLVLFERREADQHRDPVPEQGDETVLSGSEGEGSRREHVAALEAADSSRSPRRSARAVIRVDVRATPVDVVWSAMRQT